MWNPDAPRANRAEWADRADRVNRVDRAEWADRADWGGRAAGRSDYRAFGCFNSPTLFHPFPVSVSSLPAFPGRILLLFFACFSVCFLLFSGCSPACPFWNRIPSGTLFSSFPRLFPVRFPSLFLLFLGHSPVDILSFPLPPPACPVTPSCAETSSRNARQRRAPTPRGPTDGQSKSGPGRARRGSGPGGVPRRTP